MATIADLLQEVINQKDALANNLTTMGVGSESTETLNSLVPKVLDIKGSGKSPYIGSTMTWFEYDDETQTYVDTGINAEGTDGKSAYEVAVENGFIGTVSEWLASLKGDTGASGYTPVKGVDYFTSTDIASLGIDNKVDKVTGKGLSTNDLTATLKVIMTLHTPITILIRISPF